MKLMRKAADPIGLDSGDVLGTILEVLGRVEILLVVVDLEATGFLLLLGRVGGILSSLTHTHTHTHIYIYIYIFI